MLMKANFTLTSRAGRFEFDDCTIMSHAKIVRDTITACVMGVMEGGVRPPKPERAVTWIRENVVGPAKNTMFTWYPV